jgi:3-keto-5-aminohexanoate cleavage enzyme
MSSTPVIIEVALNGGTGKTRNPDVPRDPEDIATDAIACIDAGASIVHSHIEDIHTAGQAAADRYADGWRAVRAARPNAILYPTVVLAEDRATKFAHLEPRAREGLIEMAAFDPGSTDFAFSPGADGLPDRRKPAAEDGR